MVNWNMKEENEFAEFTNWILSNNRFSHLNDRSNILKHKDWIKSRIQEGYTIKSIYLFFLNKGIVNVCYSSFAKTIRKFVLEKEKNINLNTSLNNFDLDD